MSLGKSCSLLCQFTSGPLFLLEETRLMLSFLGEFQGPQARDLTPEPGESSQKRGSEARKAFVSPGRSHQAGMGTVLLSPACGTKG